MPASPVLIAVGCVVVCDLFIVPLIISAIVRTNWTPMVDRFPRVEPLPTAVRRDFQSFRAGVMGLGSCIHVAADEQHLHLSPSWFARRLGITPASIPWDRITLISKGIRNSRIHIPDAKIDLRGPRWCLDLADKSAA